MSDEQKELKDFVKTLKRSFLHIDTNDYETRKQISIVVNLSSLYHTIQVMGCNCIDTEVVNRLDKELEIEITSKLYSLQIPNVDFNGDPRARSVGIQLPNGDRLPVPAYVCPQATDQLLVENPYTEE